MTTAEQVMEYVRSKLHDGQCPGAGALGELCYLDDSPHDSPTGETMHATHMCVWKDSVTATQVAGFFREAGASEVHISQWMHDEFNDIVEGRCTLDNTRGWDIQFWLPKAGPQKPAPRTCADNTAGPAA